MCNTYTNKLNFDVIKSREKRCEDLMKNMRCMTRVVIRKAKRKMGKKPTTKNIAYCININEIA